MKNSTNKILIIAVVLLLIANIALVTFMVMGNKDDKKVNPREEAFKAMAKELNMSEDQQKDYKQQKENFFKTNKVQFDSLRAARIAFFNLVRLPEVSDSTLAVYNQRIGERQAAINNLTFAHFKKVRGLFTAEQQPKFDAFVEKMMAQRGKRDSVEKK